MKAVILAAGKSTRTYPLTLTRPKALLSIVDRPLLQFNLESLEGKVDEVILVVGHMKGMVKERFGPSFGGMRIRYVEQGEQLGTAHALLAAEPCLEGRFLVLMGDDIYQGEAVESMMKEECAVLVQEVRDPSRFGVWVGDRGRVRGFAEKPVGSVSSLANCGMYVLDEGIFDCIRRLEKSERGEYELNEAVNEFAKANDVRIVDAENRWISVGYPWSILEAGQRILSGMENDIKGEVEEGVIIEGNVHIGPGTVVKNGTRIEGPAWIGKDCVIGPHAYIRPDTVIEDGCRVRAEVVDSLIMRNTTAKHHSYIGHSVVGEGCNIAAGTVTADFRHDGKSNWSVVNGKRIDTGRRKLGAFIGDRARTGINTSFYPGRKLWPGRTTLPGEVVKRDKT